MNSDLDHAYREGVLAERRAVVADLRRVAAMYSKPHGTQPLVRAAYMAAADRIERVEHHGS